MTKRKEKKRTDGLYYRIVQARDGLVDVWLTPGVAVPMMDDLTGRIDYTFQIMAAVGIDPNDPEWDGDLETHIRRHYADWVKSAEMIEL